MSSRRAVPDAARRSLWLAAAWTGVGAVIVCATLGVVGVAICWLPVSGATAHPLSALHAGLLTYLAALHGGITVDATAAQFVPLGLTIIVGYTAWRAGAALADAADELGETEPVRLAQALAVQAGSFAVASLVVIPFATLGTSHAPFLGVAAASLLLFAVTGGVSFVRASPLAEWCLVRVPDRVVNGSRAAAAALAVAVGGGAVLVAGSVAAHAGRVEELSRQVGGGWGGVPVLLLGLLAVPNAVIAAIGYLAGPGFALGSGTHVGLGGSTHGVLPAFPILGAVPSGAAPPQAWALVVLTPLAAGAVAARVCHRAARWRERLVELAAMAAAVCVAMGILAWQAGGGIGSGRLAVVGPSPWLAGVAVAGELTVAALLWLGMFAARAALAGRRLQPATVAARIHRLVVVPGSAADDEAAADAGQPTEDTDAAAKPSAADGAGELAG